MTATDLTKEPQDKAPRMVRLTVLGGDTTEVPLVDGQLVGYYLDEAGITVADDQSVTLNRLAATRETPVEADSDRQVVITVAPQVANG